MLRQASVEETNADAVLEYLDLDQGSDATQGVGVGGIASAAGVGMVPPLPSEPESTLSTELANLAQLFASGALSSVEFANAKDACIKTYST